MSEQQNPFELLIEQFREVVREEIRSALNGRGSVEDRMLDIHEAAKVIGMSEDWIYHNRKKLPFARKLAGKKGIRFSHVGIMRWLETKKFS